jgi:hypothetical protein
MSELVCNQLARLIRQSLFRMNPKRPPQPLIPNLLLSGVPGEEEFCELEYKKVEKEIQGRFGLPIAKLANLPPHLSQETFYVEITELEERPEAYWNEGEVSFIGLSQIKYVGEIYTIHIATFLISPASLKIGFQSSESLTLNDQTSVMVQAWVKNSYGNGYTGTNLFPLPKIDLTVDNQLIIQMVPSNDNSEEKLPDHGFHPSFNNQIVFKKDDSIVTVSSDLELQDLKDIIERHIVIE